MGLVWKTWDGELGEDGAKGKGTSKGVTVPICVAKGLTWVAEGMVRVVGKEPVLTVKNLGDGVAQRWFDNGAARKVLGYVPATSLADGVEEAVVGYKAVRGEAE